MSSPLPLELCVHCGNQVLASTKVQHERACIQQKRAAEFAAHHQRRGGMPPNPPTLGMAPSFKIPAPPQQTRAPDDKNRAGFGRTYVGPGQVGPALGSHAIGAPNYGFPSQPIPPQPSPRQTSPPIPLQQTVQDTVPVAPQTSRLPVPPPRQGAVATSQMATPATAAAPGVYGAPDAPGGPAAGATVTTGTQPSTPRATSAPEGSYSTKFHPHAQRAPINARLDPSQPAPMFDVTQINYEPWRPFATRTDYDLAEFMLTSGLNHGQVTVLFDIINRVVADPRQLTVKSYQDIQNAWKLASSKQPAFYAEEFVVQYDHGPITYKFQHRDAWDWAESLVTDPLMCRYFVWHAYKQARVMNGKWVRFLDEPFTADRLWDFESTLPDDGIALPFVLYADKTRLSSFGTQQAYPVITRLANLPASIRNGSGHGGGQIVGFLPLVSDEKEKHKPKFVTHKREVWHEALKLILKKVAEFSHSGKKVFCGDKKWRRFFPLILMCIADYEEQAVMTLIRGVNGLFPCPVCLVPAEEQARLGLAPLYPLRTQEQAQSIVMNATLSDREKEARLKKISARDVVNVFWSIADSDPHKTNSFDRLHAYHTGLFKHHILDLYQKVLQNADTIATEMVHDQIDAVPRWPDLYHATDVATFKFADGSKYEDLSKVLVPTTYNVLLSIDSCGLSLMRLMRVYCVLDMYAGLEVQTEERIQCFENTLPRFSAAIELYRAQRPQKYWEFPKDHTHQHVPADIRAKGATKHYNTKPNEKAHGEVKIIYRERTNFKNVEEQISRIQHQFVVARFTRYQLDALEELIKPSAPVVPQDEPTDLHRFHHVYVGSHDNTVPLTSLQHTHAGTHTFDDLPARLSEFIAELDTSHHPPDITERFMVTPWKYMRISYESVETWKVKVDKLRITPDWYGKPRYDWIVFRGMERGTYHFGQLNSVFTCVINGVLYPLALVTVCDVVYAPRSRVDHELGLLRIRPRHNAYDSSVFIHLGSIVRAALVIPDYLLPATFQYKGTEEEEAMYSMFYEMFGVDERSMDQFWSDFYRKEWELPVSDDFLVIDLVDADMFLRLRDYFNLDT